MSALRGVSALGGGQGEGGVCSQGEGGVCSWGVSASGGGGLLLGGVCLGDVSQHALRQTPPLLTESQTPVKTLPWPNFVAPGKNICR